MHYVIVVAGLALLIGLHELVVWSARRTIRRPWAVLLGPIAGYLVLVGFALALYAGYGISVGHRVHVVSEAMPGYDAAGKLEAGDRILEVDRVAVSPTGASLTERVQASGGKPVVLTIERAGERRDITVQPKQSDDGGRTVWLLGIKRSVEDVRVHDTGAAIRAAAVYPVVTVRHIAEQTYEMIAGSEEPEPGGPVRIVEEFITSSRQTTMRALELLMVSGVYAWLALGILDLVRLVSLSRRPDARSSAS